MTMLDKMMPLKVDGRRPHFAIARKSGGLLYLSGQLPFGPDMKIKGDSVAEQTAICLGNIERVLAEHGLGLSDVLKTTVWLAKVEDFPAFNHAYAEAFHATPLPVRSTVRADLMVEGALVEIEAVAELHEDYK